MREILQMAHPGHSATSPATALVFTITKTTTEHNEAASDTLMAAIRRTYAEETAILPELYVYNRRGYAVWVSNPARRTTKAPTRRYWKHERRYWEKLQHGDGVTHQILQNVASRHRWYRSRREVGWHAVAEIVCGKDASKGLPIRSALLVTRPWEGV